MACARVYAWMLCAQPNRTWSPLILPVTLRCPTRWARWSPYGTASTAVRGSGCTPGRRRAAQTMWGRAARSRARGRMRTTSCCCDVVWRGLASAGGVLFTPGGGAQARRGVRMRRPHDPTSRARAAAKLTPPMSRPRQCCSCGASYSHVCSGCGAGCRQNEPDTVAGTQNKQTGCGEARQESGESVTVVAIAYSYSLRY